MFEVGSLICGVAPNSTALIVGRAIAGVGAAGLSSGAYTIVGFAAPPAQTGYVKPILPFGAVLATIGTGLFYTLDIGTSTGKWAGYQILAGAGWGASIQFPMIIAQSSVQPQDLSMITACS